jgi:hypothetical protein
MGERLGWTGTLLSVHWNFDRDSEQFLWVDGNNFRGVRTPQKIRSCAVHIFVFTYHKNGFQKPSIKSIGLKQIREVVEVVTIEKIFFCPISV